MKLSGNHEFSASAADVYGRLLDPSMLLECMPGCRSLEPVSDERFEITFEVPVPAIKGTFSGTVQIVDQAPPESFGMKIDASGQNGFVRADADMRIQPNGSGCTVYYDADAQVGGPAAAVGQRVLTGISRRQIDQMMRCLDAGARRPGVFARLRAWFRRLFGGGAPSARN
jgi:carbon monoxide dehydrogenase subunit G